MMAVREEKNGARNTQTYLTSMVWSQGLLRLTAYLQINYSLIAGSPHFPNFSANVSPTSTLELSF